MPYNAIAGRNSDYIQNIRAVKSARQSERVFGLEVPYLSVSFFESFDLFQSVCTSSRLALPPDRQSRPPCTAAQGTMHEQLLYGQVPAVRHEQLLSILAGITAMQPQRVIERRALYKPIKNVSSNLIQRGGTQGIQNPQKSVPSQRQNDLHYLHLIKSVEEKDFGQTVNVTTSYDVAVQGRKEPRKPWRFELQDTPELGKRPVGFRYAHLTDIIGGDPHKFMVDFGYR